MHTTACDIILQMDILDCGNYTVEIIFRELKVYRELLPCVYEP